MTRVHVYWETRIDVPYGPIIINGTCNKRGVVYELVCKLCSMGNVKYQGEADRPVHYRLQEHIRTASKPLILPQQRHGSALLRMSPTIANHPWKYLYWIYNRTQQKGSSQKHFLYTNISLSLMANQNLKV